MHTILAYRQFSVFELIFLSCLAIFVLWLVARQIKKEKAPGEFCCYMLYCFGAVSIIMWCLPDAGLEEELGQAGLRVLFGLGTGFICLGLLLHLLLWKLGRLSPRPHRKTLILMIILVAPGAAVLQLLESAGLEGWLVYLVFGTLIFLVLLVVFGVSASRRPANRIIRLIKQKQYEQAVVLGESLSAEQCSPDVKINLAVSYYLAGRKDKAESLFEEVVHLPELPDAFARVANDWLARLAAERDTTEHQA